MGQIVRPLKYWAGGTSPVVTYEHVHSYDDGSRSQGTTTAALIKQQRHSVKTGMN
jgi:hypothetical protein